MFIFADLFGARSGIVRAHLFWFIFGEAQSPNQKTRRRAALLGEPTSRHESNAHLQRTRRKNEYNFLQNNKPPMLRMRPTRWHPLRFSGRSGIPIPFSPTLNGVGILRSSLCVRSEIPEIPPGRAWMRQTNGGVVGIPKIPTQSATIQTKPWHADPDLSKQTQQTLKTPPPVKF